VKLRPFAPGSPRAIWYLALIGLAFCVACAVLPWDSNIQARVGLCGVGVVVMSIGILRPRGVWESGQLEGWRWAFGDHAVAFIYVALGAAFAVGAWLLPLS
jgi:hypothetical protein